MGVREEHIDLVKRGLALTERGEYDRLRSGMTDDVVWAGAITRPPVQGADQMIAIMKEYGAEFEVKTKFDSVDYFGDEDQVIAHEHVRLTRDGRTFDTEAVEVFEFRDGRISKVMVFTGDPRGMASFMGTATI